MPLITFLSSDPGLHDLAVDKGALGARADEVINHEAYLDNTHPHHMRAVSLAGALFEAMFGDEPVEGGRSQPFDVMSFQTGTAQPGEPT